MKNVRKARAVHRSKEQRPERALQIFGVVNRITDARATYPFMVIVWQCVCEQMKEPTGRWKRAKIKSGPQTKFQNRRFSARTSGLSLTETTISYI